jgi:hypothetical protein
MAASERPDIAPAPAPVARLVRATIQLDIVADDGQTLRPVPVAPFTLDAEELATFSPAAALAEVQRQLGARP